MCSTNISKVSNNVTNIFGQMGGQEAQQKGNLAGISAQKANPPGESPAVMGNQGAGWQNEINGIKGNCGKAGGADLKAEIGKLLSSVGDLLKSLGSMLGNCKSKMDCKQPKECQPGCVQPPKPEDGCHPSGGLTADQNCVTTPGGYKITPTGPSSWKIDGPDGKSTTVHGDPHVSEGDSGKWDFKKDSTFVLGDGTRINVTTTPPGKNGMTVTKQLDIINGNDHVAISDIDKGKGKIGQVTQTGEEQAAKFGNKDVITMGKETDDWSFQGKEIIGSEKGGESFKLGKDLETPEGLAPLVDQADKFGGGDKWADAVNNGLNKTGQSNNSLAKAIESLGQIFSVLSQLLKATGINA
jgi:hypothetical protein